MNSFDFKSFILGMFVATAAVMSTVAVIPPSVVNVPDGSIPDCVLTCAEIPACELTCAETPIMSCPELPEPICLCATKEAYAWRYYRPLDSEP